MVQKGEQKGYAEFGQIEVTKIYLREREKMKKLLPLVICFMFVGVGSISAQTETSILYKKHTFELGPEVSYITYKEPGVLKEKGTMYGVVGSYAYHNRIMLKMEGRFTFGKLDYYALGGAPVPENNNPDHMYEFRGLGGYDFSILKSFVLTPFLGIGYRYFYDDVHSQPYERESIQVLSFIKQTPLESLPLSNGVKLSVHRVGHSSPFSWSPTGIARGILLHAPAGRHPGQMLAHPSTGKASGLLVPG